MLLVQAGLELPESVLYTAALDMDRQLDAKIMQHRAHVAGPWQAVPRRLRKHCESSCRAATHNTAQGPPGQASGESAMQVICCTTLHELLLCLPDLCSM